MKKLFFTFGLNLGLGYDYSKNYYYDKPTVTVSQPHFFAVGRFAMGYNTDEYYFGISTYTEQNVIGVQDHRVNFQQGEVRMVFVKRFSGKFKYLNKIYRTRIARIFAPKDKKE